MHDVITAAVILVLAIVALLVWVFASTWAPAGRKVTVSLVDGSVITGRVRRAWPTRIRLAEVETADGEVPGLVVLSSRQVATVQVTA